MKFNGSKELKEFVDFINNNRIEFPEEMKNTIRHLISKWRKKNKTTDDFFMMKNDHNYISSFFESNVIVVNPQLNELWNNYLNMTLTFRIQRVAVEHPNIYYL